MNYQHSFAFAGLWEQWEKQEPAIESFSLIKIGSNAVMEPIHHMPVILTTTQYPERLDTSLHEPARLTALLRPVLPREMEAFPISLMVNKPKNDQPECVMPI